MSKEDLKVKPVSSEVANDDLKNAHGGYHNDECPCGVSDGNGGLKKLKFVTAMTDLRLVKSRHA